LVVITEEGALYHLFDSGGWTKIGHHENLKSYNLLQISPCRKLVSLSGKTNRGITDSTTGNSTSQQRARVKSD
jgi:hypothetical protein